MTAARKKVERADLNVPRRLRRASLPKGRRPDGAARKVPVTWRLDAGLLAAVKREVKRRKAKDVTAFVTGALAAATGWKPEERP